MLSSLDAVDGNCAFVGADFSSLSVSESLEFFFTASQQIYVVSKPQVGKKLQKQAWVDF